MKIFIGKYKNFVGCFQIADLLQHIGVSEGTCYKIGEWLSKTKLDPFLQWVYTKRKRNIKIRIDNYDIWNFDGTLALLILPGLKMIREDKHGAPFVDDEDVPDELKSTNTPPKEHEYDTDSLWFQRWDFVLDEMVWSFENFQPESDWKDQFHHGVIDFKFEKCKDNSGISQMVKGEKDTHVFDKEGYDRYNARIQNGCRLFGKYFSSLWT